jgi:hypothetical protein
VITAFFGYKQLDIVGKKTKERREYRESKVWRREEQATTGKISLLSDRLYQYQLN